MTLRGGTDVTGVALGDGSRDTPQCITTSAIFPRKNPVPQKPLNEGRMGQATAFFPRKTDSGGKPESLRHRIGSGAATPSSSGF